MGGYILCQVKKASLPYYIENISTNIYTIEELCYYFYHNIYLLDETIINEHLCDWLKKELGLVNLYRRLYKILEEEKGTAEFILAVFKEIHYLTHSEFKQLNETLELLQSQPGIVREKKKGDYLAENKMYVNALRIYENALGQEEREGLGEQFAGGIWYNMGCAYMHLFQFREASDCFLEAFKLLRSKQAMSSHLRAGYLADPESFTDLCRNAGADKEQEEEIIKTLEETMDKAEISEEEPEVLLEEFIRRYHKSTGF